MSINTQKNSTYIIVGVAVVFIIILIFQFISGPNEQYALDKVREREKRDEFFKTSSESPLTDSMKLGFTSLAYFQPDVKWRLMADFLPNEEYQLVELAHSGGKPDFFEKAGQLRFEIDGEKYFLTGYRQAEGSRKSLFIPFKDQTSGKSTYGGGRYIDAQLIGEKAMLDFNTAYNPYCVYNWEYVCPLPPDENNLQVAIEAGEKMFGQKSE